MSNKPKEQTDKTFDNKKKEIRDMFFAKFWSKPKEEDLDKLEQLIREQTKAEERERILKVVDDLRNPYPESVFVEPTEEQYDAFNKHAKEGGFCVDAYNGSWGRRVFNLCKEDIIKAIKELKEAIQEDKTNDR